jgi:hypothetical protein
MSEQKVSSPRINELSWGRMAVDGVGTGKDFKLWPGGGREWDWMETGTHHIPGIQPADVEELLANGSQAIVLTQGMLLRLQTCSETMSFLEAKGIAVYVAETTEAARIYNDLALRGEAVGGLFHSTC